MRRPYSGAPPPFTKNLPHQLPAVLLLRLLDRLPLHVGRFISTAPRPRHDVVDHIAGTRTGIARHPLKLGHRQIRSNLQQVSGVPSGDRRPCQPCSVSELRYAIFSMLLADDVQKPLQPLGNSSPTRLPQCNNHPAPVFRVNVWERVDKKSRSVVRITAPASIAFSATPASLAPSNPTERKSTVPRPLSKSIAATLLEKFSSSRNLTQQPRK